MATEIKKFVDLDALDRYDGKIKSWSSAKFTVCDVSHYDISRNGVTEISFASGMRYVRITCRLAVGSTVATSGRLMVKTGSGETLCDVNLSGIAVSKPPTGVFSVDAFYEEDQQSASYRYALQGMVQSGGDAVLLTGGADVTGEGISILCEACDVKADVVEFRTVGS